MYVDAPGPDRSNSTGMIVGTTVGVTVLLIAVTVILLCLIILRKRRLSKASL